MGRRTFLVGVFALLTLQGQAQTDDFKAFRERMLSDYQDFRKGIMERYEEFLDAAWAEYETMAGRRRVTQPKPVVAPVYTPPQEPVPPVEVTPAEPEPVSPVQPVEPAEPTEPVVPADVPAEPKEPTTPKVPTTPKIPEVPTIPPTPTPSTPQIRFELYGLQLGVPAPRLDATLYSADQQEVVAFWKRINESGMQKCVETLQQHATNYHLGDWCTFKAVESYAQQWANGNRHAERVMMQYLMLSMGYDVRLAIADNSLYLLLPIEQKVYSNSYIPIDEMKYYIYPSTIPANSRIYSCSIPSDEECGRQLNLIINPAYLLPENQHHFMISYGGLTAEGSVNKNVIALQQEYPSMDIYCYASSVADDKVRKKVVSQLKTQVAGMTETEAANALLHFVQRGFEYQTDGQQFGEGVEKSFFFDETLYFPYCDCEDRSIFYAYLVREILGLDVLLIGYPGHECTAVALSVPPPSYTGFAYKGKKYYICDPTYMGADVGMCMPNYIDESPEIEEWY